MPGLDGVPGLPEVGDGIHLDPDSLDNEIDLALLNRVDGDAVIYLHNEAGMALAGFDLTAASNPTNLGKIVVIDCTDITVQNNVVANFSGHLDQHAAGILILRSSGVTTALNVVSDIRGGPELLASGILLDGVSEGGILDNNVSRVFGGPDGAAYGIRLRGSINMTASGNVVRDIIGQDSGIATGIHLVDSTGLELGNSLLHSIEGGMAFGLRLNMEAAARASHFTVHGVAGSSDAYGVLVDQDCSLTLGHSIVGSTTGHGVWNHPQNQPVALGAYFTDSWNNPLGNFENVNRSGEEDNFSLDPAFLDPDSQDPDFHLEENSPCVDAGDPDEVCENEPLCQDQNRCILDLGFYGGTGEAGCRPGE